MDERNNILLLCFLSSYSSFSLLILFLMKLIYNNMLVNFAGSLYNPNNTNQPSKDINLNALEQRINDRMDNFFFKNIFNDSRS